MSIDTATVDRSVAAYVRAALAPYAFAGGVRWVCDVEAGYAEYNGPCAAEAGHRGLQNVPTQNIDFEAAVLWAAWVNTKWGTSQFAANNTAWSAAEQARKFPALRESAECRAVRILDT